MVIVDMSLKIMLKLYGLTYTHTIWIRGDMQVATCQATDGSVAIAGLYAFVMPSSSALALNVAQPQGSRRRCHVASQPAEDTGGMLNIP